MTKGEREEAETRRETTAFCVITVISY